MARNNTPADSEKKIALLPGLLIFTAVQCERCIEAGSYSVCFKECAEMCRETAAMLLEANYVLPSLLDACADCCTACGMECEQQSISEQYLSCTLACLNCSLVCKEQVLSMLN